MRSNSLSLIKTCVYFFNRAIKSGLELLFNLSCQLFPDLGSVLRFGYLVLLESRDHLVLHFHFLLLLRLLFFLQEVVLPHVLLLRDNSRLLDSSFLFCRIRGVQVERLVIAP